MKLSKDMTKKSVKGRQVRSYGNDNEMVWFKI